MKNRILALGILAALILSVCVLPSHAYEAFSYIKVGLSFGSASVNSFTATTEQNMVIGYAADRSFVPLLTLEGRDVLVEKGGGTYLMTQYSYPGLAEALAGSRELRNQGYEAHGGYINGEYKVLVGLYANEAAAQEAKQALSMFGIAFDSVYLDMKAVMVRAGYSYIVFRDDTKLFAFGSDGYGTTKVNGKNYRGYLLADRVHSSAIAIVNLVSFDDYTASVVGSEMYSTWPIEALKAQAVVARSYAATVTGYKGYGIDVTDDTRTQAYNGTVNETASTRRAAAETSGMLVMYNGKPAQTYFTSSSGGRTADVYSAWGGGQGLDYLKSVPDVYEDTENIPHGVWSVSYTAEQLKSKLAAKGVQIGDITNVYCADRGTDERVRKLTFEGTEGDYSVTFDSCRTFLSLGSQYYTVTAPNPQALYATGDGTAQMIDRSAPALTASGMQAIGQNTCVLGAEGVYSAPKDANGSYVFAGRGYGHGVGLSQYGAKGMAEAGYTFSDIIAHYYPGTQLSN